MIPKTKRLFFQGAIFLVPAIVTFLVQIQGFNFLDDGLWLLGTRTIARGGLLYRDIFSIYGPVKYYALLPFFMVLGESIRTLIVFKAIVTGSASILGFFVARRYGMRRLAFLVPLGVMALGPIPLRYVCATAFSILLSEMMSRNGRSATRGLILGLAWGLLALFGLDMMVYGTIIIVAGTIFAYAIGGKKPIFDLRRDFGVLIGLSSIIVLSVLVAAALGILDSFVWDTTICPLTYSPNHIGPSFFDGLIRPEEFGPVFSQVFTGENLDSAWPGHVWQRLVSIRVMTAAIVLAPIFALIIRRRIDDPRIGPIFALALAGWITILWRSDVAHLTPAFYGTLLLLICLFDSVHIPKVPAAVVGVTFLAAALGPLAGEGMWLIAHRDRPALVTWDRPTAEIAMARNRRDTLEQLIGALDEDESQPTIAWPAHPGLVFLSGKTLVTSQATLLAGGVQNPLSVIEDLRKGDPDQLIIGRVAGLAPGKRSMQSLSPSIWTYLRSHFFIEQQFADGAEGFEIIRNTRSIGANAQDVPLERQLPGSVHLVKNSMTPILTPETVIGQVLEVGGLDFHGITLLVATKGALPAEIEMEIGVEELLNNGHTRNLGRYVSRIFLGQKVQHCSLVFPPIPHTAGKTILVSFSATTEGTQEIRLLWHDSQVDKGDFVDYYPDGYSLINGKQVNADLFFISY